MLVTTRATSRPQFGQQIVSGVEGHRGTGLQWTHKSYQVPSSGSTEAWVSRCPGSPTVTPGLGRCGAGSRGGTWGSSLGRLLGRAVGQREDINLIKWWGCKRKWDGKVAVDLRRCRVTHCNASFLLH